MPEDTISIRVRLREALKARKDAHQVAAAIDEIGDEAQQTSRRLDRMNVSSARTTQLLTGMGKASNSARINIGPLSTSLRGGALAVGALVLGAQKATPVMLSLGEATATLIGGAGGAGAVGLLALGQAGGVASLGLGGLQDALGGNEQAIKRLHPAVRRLYRTLHAEQGKLRREAQRGLLPGLGAGTRSASRNFGVVNRLTRGTGRALGGIASDAGDLFGSRGFGRDLGTVGRSNIRIIDDLGHATLNLADASRHVVVEASPLARWLAREAEEGAHLADVWVRNQRETGKLRRFFREARTDLTLLGSAGGHTTHGLINLFGSQDVDGTKTLRSLDRVTARFERWSDSPAVRRSVSQAIEDEIPQATAVLLDSIAHTLPKAGGTAAKVFIESFMHADAWGKLLAGGFLAKKLGAGGLLRKLLFGGGGGGLGGGRGLAGKANPIPVWVVNQGGLPGKGPGGPPAARKSIGRRILDAGKKGAPLAGEAGFGLATGGGIVYGLVKLGQMQHGPASPQRDRAAAQATAGAMGFNTNRFRTDARGFPIAPGVNFNVQPQRINISVDGRAIAHADATYRVKQSARRAGR